MVFPGLSQKATTADSLAQNKQTGVIPSESNQPNLSDVLNLNSRSRATTSSLNIQALPSPLEPNQQIFVTLSEQSQDPPTVSSERVSYSIFTPTVSSNLNQKTKSSNLPRRRRIRTSFSQAQLDVLEVKF